MEDVRKFQQNALYIDVWIYIYNDTNSKYD